MKKNGFAKVSKKLTRYKSENNFVKSSKQLCRTLKLVARMSKLFAALLITLEFLTQLFWRSDKIIFRCVSSEICRCFSKILLSLYCWAYYS